MDEETKSNVIDEEAERALEAFCDSPSKGFDINEKIERDEPKRTRNLMTELEEKLFRDEINSFPYWVRTANDALVYARHLNYRLIQASEILRVNDMFIRENDYELYQKMKRNLDLMNVYIKYDDAYNTRDQND